MCLLNICSDHGHVMAVRDSGCNQLFAEANQDADDLRVRMFCIDEVFVKGLCSTE